MKEALIYLWLVAYPACGEAIYDLITGPYSSTAVCEIQLDLITAVKGPPSPGSIYWCGVKP